VVTNPIDGRYVDGGVRENIPFSHAIEMGFEEIWLFLNSPLDENEHFDIQFDVKGIRKIGTRALELLMVESYLQDIELLLERNKDPLNFKQIDLKIIAPQRNILGTMDFDPIKIAVGISAGREAALKVIGQGSHLP
jgi:predicted acylesterase/phospholipase RssA